MENVAEELTNLFNEAQATNEFEFIMTLLNYKCIGHHEAQANLYEWFDALASYERELANLDGKAKARKAALIYSTFYENSDFYNVIGSLCRIALGYRGSSYLFWKTRKYERLLGIGEKQDLLTDLLSDANKKSIVAFFETNHFPEIRNSFFHSAYSIIGDEYTLHDSPPITINGVGQTSFSLTEFFYPLVEQVLIFFNTFRSIYLDSLASYQEDKVIGANPLGQSGIIIGTPNGLGGIRIPNAVQFYGEWHDSGIWYDHRFEAWSAHNLHFNMASIETIEISDQLSRYEAKGNVRITDLAFNNLMDKIADREQVAELTRAYNLLFSIGEKKYAEMRCEQNEHKKRSLPKTILPFYRRAAEMLPVHPNIQDTKNRIKELEELH
jgi:hypothetical protein